MKNTIRIITNNPRVFATFERSSLVQYRDCDYVSVLTLARDAIHLGHFLLTHPMAGSLKPNQTPYKTLIISAYSQKVHFESVRLIEKALESAEKFLRCRPTPQWGNKALFDFQTVDLSFIEKAVNNQHEIPKRRYAS